MTTYFDEPCASPDCGHRRGSHYEPPPPGASRYYRRGCKVKGCNCTAWRAA
jgi:hypothetical protein